MITMWLKQCHQPAMAGIGWNPTVIKNGEIGDGLWLCFTHIIMDYIYCVAHPTDRK